MTSYHVHQALHPSKGCVQETRDQDTGGHWGVLGGIRAGGDAHFRARRQGGEAPCSGCPHSHLSSPQLLVRVRGVLEVTVALGVCVKFLHLCPHK
jgi:hypothetical protein